jgi:hypothetical protein
MRCWRECKTARPTKKDESTPQHPEYRIQSVQRLVDWRALIGACIASKSDEFSHSGLDYLNVRRVEKRRWGWCERLAPLALSTVNVLRGIPAVYRRVHRPQTSRFGL